MFHVTRRCSTSERLCERPLFAPCAQEADEEIQKIIRNRSDDVGVSLGLRAVSGPISHSHQHMRPCTLQAFPHFPRQCEGATPDATQSRPSCQNKMLRRKHQQVRPSALGSQKACAQIASLHANIDFEPANSEAQSKSSRCMAASSLFFALARY